MSNSRRDSGGRRDTADYADQLEDFELVVETATKGAPLVGRAAENDRAALARGWVRLGGLAGLLSFVISVGGVIVLGGANNLTGDSTPAQISQYLSSNSGSVLALTVTTLIGSVIGVWFIASVARLVSERDPKSPLGSIILGFGILATTIVCFDGVTLSALVVVAKQGGATDASVSRIFFDLANGLIMPGLFGWPIAGFMVALGVAMIRGVVGARWVGWLSCVLAVLAATGSVIGLTQVDGGTSALGYSPIIGYGLIALIVSIFMVRARPAA